MAENPGAPLSFIAAADLRTKQFFLVKISAANTVDLAGDGELAIGALQNKPNIGEAAVVSLDGNKTWVSCGAAVAVGNRIASDANGQGILATTGEEGCGQANTATGAISELFEMIQFHVGPVA